MTSSLLTMTSSQGPLALGPRGSNMHRMMISARSTLTSINAGTQTEDRIQLDVESQVLQLQASFPALFLIFPPFLLISPTSPWLLPWLLPCVTISYSKSNALFTLPYFGTTTLRMWLRRRNPFPISVFLIQLYSNQSHSSIINVTHYRYFNLIISLSSLPFHHYCRLIITLSVI